MNVLRQDQNVDFWDSFRVKAELQRRGLSLAGLSREHGFHQNSAARALRVSWPVMEEIISDALGVAPDVIWPDRYENGIPKKYLPRRQNGPG
jgi:Ner family transcriptional regulator